MTERGEKPRKRKPGAGAPAGNQNAAKSPNPILRRLKRGLPVPPEITFALNAAAQETEPLYDHCGGWENCSETQRLVIANFCNLEQLKFIVWQQAYKSGAIQVAPGGGDWDLSEGLKRIVAIVNSQNKILQSLGMKRHARNVNGLQELFNTEENPDTDNAEPLEKQEKTSSGDQ